ncbi:MAG: sulfatase [Prolixibacteraceae bacterium]|jgi:arylsulfatase A-like enzyme|nr:sulfatase [Prolixibacteraceae bacterium]MBT6005041.1 sulfatase [Prolixibacteraceae bacterium]MBT6764231.1 sulfatase [Prolixibacteraceae bacterium]MBT6997135.1 sulfatase [Prolixibacteraceae bacterium]MBT7393332.1 sulfatase [Prolixibacteraceae bacterium]
MKSKFILFVFLFFSFFAMVSCQPKMVEPTKPNILFILADDFGYHDLSVTGSKFYETPNIDRIANEGMIFTDGYATCQVCSPSRASIMSGKFPARHGITDWIGARTGEEWRKAGRFNQLLPPEYVHALPHEYTTLPEAMKEVGYKTFFAGKWHIGTNGSWPEDHGFDINKGGWDVGSPRGGYFSPWENPNLESGPDGENLSMRLAQETVNFIKENKDTSFFAYLSFYAVHGPIQTTQEKWTKYRQKAEDLGIAKTGFEMGHFLPIRQVQDNPVYAGLVEAMDDAVGHVLISLDEMGLAENTIVVFTSDNGGVAAGDAFATSNLPLRAGKGYQFEGGIREPYFIKVPGMGNGQKCNTPVTGTDFYPTLLELAGAELKPEEHIDGVSLVPLLKGETISARPLIWHYPHYGNQGGEPSSIIRLGDWKLIHYYEDGHEELYNMKTDFIESEDLAAVNSELVKHLSEKLFVMLDEMGARYPTKDPDWNAGKEKEYLERVVNSRLPNLEKQRMNFLSKDFDPKNNWWGSFITND